MLVGYMRVSTDGDRQLLDLQRDALLAAGVDARHLFEDRASGSRGDRAGLGKALTFIRSGDCLVVWKLDRLGRSLPVSVAATTSFDLDRFHDPFWGMDAIMTGSGFEDASAHTSNRKSGRSGRIEIVVRADRRRSWTPEQKCQIVSESLEPGVTPSEVARPSSVVACATYTAARCRCRAGW
jgi:hypothetical protein